MSVKPAPMFLEIAGDARSRIEPKALPPDRKIVSTFSGFCRKTMPLTNLKWVRASARTRRKNQTVLLMYTLLIINKRVMFIYKMASVLSLKFVVYIAELSATLARRADDGISGIFREGPTPPASSRAGEMCNELQRQDTSCCHCASGLKPGPT